MSALSSISFPPFRLDLRAARLERDEEELALRPKTYALLQHLASRPGELLSKENLLDVLWPGRIVTEGGLSELVRELRRVLGDDARAPRFIETVHGRGYRFIARPVGGSPAVSIAVEAVAERHIAPVGRAAPLAQLASCYARAAAGARQLVFVTGEPGIGKSTVVEAFLRTLHQLPSDAVPRIGRGQCIEQYGAGEAYLPVLDALARLARQEPDARLMDALRRHAPTWLVQMPSLLESAEVARLERRTFGATRERMLREMAETFETLTIHRPLVLVLEDVHWSDYSTLDLVTFVAQRTEPARLMILATFRPVEVYTRDHPLKAIKQELEARGQCVDLPLPCLSPADVGRYLEQRFATTPGAPPMAELAPVVHRRTDGHPLFMVNVADYVAALGFANLPDSVMGSIPNSVRQMIEKQIDRLSLDEQRTLEVAAVAGFEFSAASLAAGLEVDDVDRVEDVCAAFVRRAQFLVARGEQRWPDGTVAGVFGFVHALYQNVLYYRIAPGRRSRLHLRIALREERGWGDRAATIAGELAAHFENGQDYARALDYLAIAGEKAARRCADREAIELFTHALQLLPKVDDTMLRDQHELRLSIALGAPLIHARGYAADEVAQVYGRARELHVRVGDASQLFLVLWGLWLFDVVRGNHGPAYDLGRQLQTLERENDVRFPLAHYATGCSSFWLGDFQGTVATLDHAIAVYEHEVHGQQVGLYSQDPKVVSLLYQGWALWMLGYPDRARSTCEASAAWAEAMNHPFSLAFVHDYCAVVHHLRGESALASERGMAAATVSIEHGFPFWRAWGEIMRGKAQSDQGMQTIGIQVIRQGLADYEATGAGMGKSLFLAMLAESQLHAAEYAAGIATIGEARRFVTTSGEDAFVPELFRLEGELMLGADPAASAAAESCFAAALEHARRQRARSWELRAATSLARLRQRQGRPHEARALLAPVYGWFNEGLTTRDLVAARTLLEQLDG